MQFNRIIIPALVVLSLSKVMLLSACESKIDVDNMNDDNIIDLFDSAERYFSDDKSSVNKQGLEFTDDFDGIKIVASVEVPDSDKKIHIRGMYRTYVKCGSQRAIWQGFSSHFNYVVKDMATEEVYTTQFSPLSISHAPMPLGHDGKPMPDSYSQMPCDQFDKRYFEVELYNKINDLPRDIALLEVYVKIYNLESNRVIVELTKIK